VLFVIVLAFLVLASCRTARLAKPSAAAKPFAQTDNSQFVVIGSMQNRDRIVTVKTGPAGVVYSIATKDGKSLYENITPEKLKAEAPALHEFIETGTATWAGMDRIIFLDGRR
jgi:hypothetical protein